MPFQREMNMPACFTHCYPVLYVADLILAQNYYEQTFGFQIDWRHGDYFGQVSSGDIAIFFQKNEVPIQSQTVVLNTQNADAIFDAFKIAGADIVEPIATRPWGLREFRVRDLNGHVLRISHVDESQADYSSFMRDKI